MDYSAKVRTKVCSPLCSQILGCALIHLVNHYLLKAYEVPSSVWSTGTKNILLFSCSIASDSLHLHGLQHARFPCPSPSPRACSNSCLSNWWCHPTISSSVIFSCLRFSPAIGLFPLSQFFTSGGQSIGASVLASVLPMNIQD